LKNGIDSTNNPMLDLVFGGMLAMQTFQCKKLLFVSLLALSMVGVAQAGVIFFPVDATDTYLRTDQAPFADSLATGPVFINLSALGAVPGWILRLQTMGDLCYTNVGCVQLSLPLVAAFTSSTSLGATSVLDRITAISSGAPGVATGLTNYQSLTTNIANDFEVPTGSVLSLVVPAADSFYSDNSDPAPANLGINVEAVPEPGTLFLLASGLGLLFVSRRRRA
jgi:hypothetical protein